MIPAATSLLIALVASCSLINAPGEVRPGEGGGGDGGGGASSGTGGSMPVCGDGKVQGDETCDPPGSCPTSCDDGNACTDDTLEGSADDCSARCPHAEVKTCSMVSDSCCATGCSAMTDVDCAGCGDGNVGPNETCDGNCPTSCDDGKACTLDTLVGGADTCNATCTYSDIVKCSSGDGCCPVGCNAANDKDCKLVTVGVIDGNFYTDDVRAYLGSQAGIQSATSIKSCVLQDLQKFSVVILHGNMSCFDAEVFNAYVMGGGGIVATPWIYSNNGGLDCLPVQGGSGSTVSSGNLDVTVSNPLDPLVQGVNFQNGDMVGWEEWTFSLKGGAASSVNWHNDAARIAVARWDYGGGRSVYLDFHYITSDCSLAIKYPWGQKLMHNAVLWAGKAL